MLEDLGNIGDFIGGLGVVITLVYLAVQVRQSTEQTRQNNDLIRSQISIAMRESRQTGTQVIATNREASRVFWTGLKSRADLPEEDLQQFDPLMSLFTQSWDHEFELGGSDQVQKIGPIVQQPGYREWWEIFRSTYSNAFQDMMDKRMEPDPPAAQQATVIENPSK